MCNECVGPQIFLSLLIRRVSNDNIHPKDHNDNRTTIKFSPVSQELHPNTVLSHLLSNHEEATSTQNKIKIFRIKFVNKISHLQKT